MLNLNKCNFCPRECGTDRHISAGFCGAGENAAVARAALHFWEEPIISGTRGSGAVFFSHCNLNCIYCQNYKISRGGFGREISVSRLSEIFTELENMGAHNINLVTPTPYILQIKTALSLKKPQIPIVYNCGGYEKRESIKEIKDYIDIYLTDYKYYTKESAKKYSSAPDYPKIAALALEEMIKSAGKPKIENSLMKSGVILRHLVLPSHRKESIALLKFLKENFGTENFILSLMSQYFPPYEIKEAPEINRRITSFEYENVLSAALDLGFNSAFIQERSSAKAEFVPSFDLSGVDETSKP